MNIRRLISQAAANLVRLCSLDSIDTSTPLNKVTVKVRVGVVDPGIAQVQNYGFKNAADPSSGKVLGVEVTCNGNRYVIALEDLSASPTGMQPGEVKMWHKNGDYVYMQNGNQIAAKTKKFTVDADESFTVNSPAIKLNGLVRVSEDILFGSGDSPLSARHHVHPHSHAHPDGGTDPVNTDEAVNP